MSKLTYAAFEAAAESLDKAGEEPSVRLIVAKLGGSNTMATRMLDRWKKARGAREASNVQINPAITDLIRVQITEAAVQASKDATQRASDAEEAYDELSAQAAEVETKLVARDEDLVSARAQLQQQQGQLSERARELDELRALTAAAVAEAVERAERERAQAESVRQDLVRASLRLERVPDLEIALENAKRLQTASNDEIARSRQAEAVANARADAQHERARGATAREAKLEAQLQRMQEEQDRAMTAERSSQQEILRLFTTVSTLDARCAVQLVELEQLRKALLDEADAVPASSSSSSSSQRDQACAA